MDRLTDEQRELAGRYWPLAKSIADRWCRSYPRYRDDILSVAGESLMRNVVRYDSSKGKLSTYLYFRINFDLIDWHRRRERHEARLPISYGLYDVDVSDGGRWAMEQDSHLSVETLISVACFGDVLRLLFVEGKTEKQAAGILGVCKTSVSNRKCVAFDSIRSQIHA